MKNVYLSSLLIATAFSSFAQNTNTHKVNIKATSALNAPGNLKPTLGSNGEEKALNFLWSDDFSGGTNPLETGMGQWDVSGPDSSYWSIGDNPHPLSAFNWTEDMDAEYLRWNSYGPLTGNEAGGFASTSVYGEAISPSMALVGNTNSIGIKFDTEAYYCCNFEFKPFGVAISTDDGANWSAVADLDFGVDRNEATEAIASPLTWYANLDAIAPVGPQATFKIKFVWDGDDVDANGQYNTHYFWLIDNLSIYEIPNNDVSLIEGWHADIIQDWEYSMLPTAQSSAREMIPGVVIANQGANSQTLDVTCDISDGSGIVNTTVINHTIAPGVTDTLWFSTGYMPSVNDTYTTHFSIPADDETSDDELDASDLIVNDGLMAHDYGTESVEGWDPTSTNATELLRAEEPHAYGNTYTPAVDQDLYGIDIRLAAGTSPDLYLLGRVQALTGPSIQDPLDLVVEVEYTTTPQSANSVVTLVFDSPVTLTAGTTYIIDLYKVDGTSNGEAFNITTSESMGEDDDRSTVNYGPYGTGNAVNYYTNWGYAPYVRANFDVALGIEEAELEGISIFPNPSQGVVNISNENNTNNLIEVLDVTGKVVLTKEASTSTTIDLSGSNGVFIVKVSNDLGTAVKRVVIK